MRSQMLVMAFCLGISASVFCVRVSAQTGSLAATATGTPLVAYRLFLRHVQFLESAADAASAQEATELRQYYQKELGLSYQASAQLKEVAADAISALDAIEQQAATIIQAQRALHPGGKLSSNSSIPVPPLSLIGYRKNVII
jgi:Holliday junction resolvasome RuvABC ATP-dependent DNA helicase subunit